MQPRNLYEMFQQVVEANRERVAFRHKLDGEWTDVTWSRHGQEVDRLSRGLMALGVGRGDRVGILATTRLAWVQADSAIVNCGGVTVGIYPSNLGVDCAYILNHSEAAVIFVENAEQLDKLDAVRSEIPGLRTLVLMDGIADPERGVLSWHDLLDRADEVSAERLREVGRGLEPDDLASLVYTSGTTGVPKGVMITHRNIQAAAESAGQCLVTRPDFINLTFLPLAHVFARMISYLCLHQGLLVAFAESITSIPDDLKAVRPHFITSVPRIFEKVSEKIRHGAEEAGGLKLALFRWSVGVGREVSVLQRAHRPIPFLLRLRHGLAERLVLGKIQAAFGGRLLYAISGGAPLNPATGEFFHACGVTILQGIGMTENTSFTNVNRMDNIKFDTVGPVGPGIEMKLAPDGEILFRGDNVMKGYFKDPQATAEAIDPDGWLHTGDIGEIDGDGHLKVTDRKKDLIITAGGKNIAPQKIEKILGESPYISHVVAYGDRRKYLTALVTLNADNVGKWARGNGLASVDPASLVDDDRVRELIWQEIERGNRSLASFETVKKFRILPVDLSVEGGELTPTLKPKRKLIIDRYRALVDQMYA